MLLLALSSLTACGGGTVADTLPSSYPQHDQDPGLAMDSSDGVQPLNEEPPDQHIPPGRSFFPEPGIYVEVPPDHEVTKAGNGVRFTASDGSGWFAFEWNPDPDAMFLELVQGIAGGGQLIQSNGATEDLGNNRTAFVILVSGRYTGDFKEGRYVVVERGHDRGGFISVAGIDRADDALFEVAKLRLMAILSTVEHIPEAEVAAILERERKAEQRAIQAKVQAINARERSNEERQLRQALSGKALLKSTSNSNSSSFGTDYFYSTERFDLCPDGTGTYHYSSSTNIQGMNTENDGTRYETGTLSSKDKDHSTGIWDVTMDDRGFYLELYTGAATPMSWSIAKGSGGGYIVGNKQFWVAGPEDERGPRCSP
ncbi:MAG: hypothetical protein R2815_11650 [Flavobacteriales bacterium]